MTWRKGLVIAAGLVVFLSICLAIFLVAGAPSRFMEAPSLCDEGVYSGDRSLEPADLRRGVNLEVVAHFGGGAVSDLTVQDTDAFARIGNELVMLDLSQPESPQRSGYYFFPGGFRLLRVDATEPIAIVALERSLWSVDFSDPREPSVQNLYAAPGRILDLQMRGDRAHLNVERCQTQMSSSICRKGLNVVDLSPGMYVDKPTSCSEGQVAGPELVITTFLEPSAPAEARVAMGDYVVAATENEGIRIYDSDSGTEVGFYDPPTGLVEVLSLGQYVFVAEAGGALHVLDASNPADPIKVGEFAAHQDFVDLELGEGPILHAIADGGASYLILDLASPSSPRLVSALSANSKYVDIKVSGDRVYLLEEEEGIQLIDTKQPEYPTYLGTYHPGEIVDFEVQGSWIYILVGLEKEGELLVIDWTSPDNPEVLNRTQVKTPRAFALSGSNLFLYEFPKLKILDVSNPAAPVLVGERSVRRMSDLSVDGEILFSRTGSSRIELFDISDPIEPSLLATHIGGSIVDFDLSGIHLHLAGGGDGFITLRVVTAD